MEKELITKDLKMLGNYRTFKEVENFEEFINFFKKEEGLKEFEWYTFNNVVGLSVIDGSTKRYFCAKCGNIGTFKEKTYDSITKCPNCNANHLNIDIVGNGNKFYSYEFKNQTIYYNTLYIYRDFADKTSVKVDIDNTKLCKVEDNGDLTEVNTDTRAIDALSTFYAGDMLKQVYEDLEDLKLEYKQILDFELDSSTFLSLSYFISNKSFTLDGWSENIELFKVITSLTNLKIFSLYDKQEEFKIISSYKNFIKNFDKKVIEGIFEDKQILKVFEKQLMTYRVPTIESLEILVKKISKIYLKFLDFSEDTFKILKHTFDSTNRNLFSFMNNLLEVIELIQSDFGIKLNDEIFNAFYLENHNILGLDGTHYFSRANDNIHFDILNNLYLRIEYLKKKGIDINTETLKNKNFNKFLNFNELTKAYKLPKNKVVAFDFLMDNNPLDALAIIKDRRQLNKEELKMLEKEGLLSS